MWEDTPRHKGLRKKLIRTLEAKGIKDERILEAFWQVPRHFFADITFAPNLIYDDRALPIGNKQTISQPYTVAFQTSLLNVGPGMKVLEIGTGSGFQAAILSVLGAKVFSIERFAELSAEARKKLQALNLNVSLKVGDGTLGWEEQAPYDRILVTAAAPKIAPALLQQLKAGGLLVIPVGDKKHQKMLRIKKTGQNRFYTEEFGIFSFVPLIGKEGWQNY